MPLPLPPEAVALGLQVDDRALLQLAVTAVLVVVVAHEVGEVGVGTEGNFLQGLTGHAQHVLHIVVGKDLPGYDYVRRIGPIAAQLWHTRLTARDNTGGGHAVVTVQFITLNDVNELAGVGRAGGVACLLEPSCPGFIVGGVQPEKKPIAELLIRVAQEFGMRPVTGIGVFIAAEAGFDQLPPVVDIIVFFVVSPAIPAATTFNAKVVVGTPGEVACTSTRLQEPLRQFDACRDAGPLHFQDGNFLEALQVFLMRIPLCLQAKGQAQGEEEKK